MVLLVNYCRRAWLHLLVVATMAGIGGGGSDLLVVGVVMRVMMVVMMMVVGGRLSLARVACHADGILDHRVTGVILLISCRHGGHSLLVMMMIRSIRGRPKKSYWLEEGIC